MLLNILVTRFCRRKPGFNRQQRSALNIPGFGLSEIADINKPVCGVRGSTDSGVFKCSFFAHDHPSNGNEKPSFLAV